VAEGLFFQLHLFQDLANRIGVLINLWVYYQYESPYIDPFYDESFEKVNSEPTETESEEKFPFGINPNRKWKGSVEEKMMRERWFGTSLYKEHIEFDKLGNIIFFKPKTVEEQLQDEADDEEYALKHPIHTKHQQKWGVSEEASTSTSTVSPTGTTIAPMSILVIKQLISSMFIESNEEIPPVPLASSVLNPTMTYLTQLGTSAANVVDLTMSDDESTMKGVMKIPKLKKTNNIDWGADDFWTDSEEEEKAVQPKKKQKTGKKKKKSKLEKYHGV
jgi:hypothetical protein